MLLIICVELIFRVSRKVVCLPMHLKQIGVKWSEPYQIRNLPKLKFNYVCITCARLLLLLQLLLLLLGSCRFSDSMFGAWAKTRSQ